MLLGHDRGPGAHRPDREGTLLSAIKGAGARAPLPLLKNIYISFNLILIKTYCKPYIVNFNREHCWKTSCKKAIPQSKLQDI